jgi:hypothetical protein
MCPSDRSQPGLIGRVRPRQRETQEPPGANTPWKVSLLASLAIVARRTGCFSKTLRFGEEAWQAGKDSQDAHVRALAERGHAERLELLARLGRLCGVDQSKAGARTRPWVLANSTAKRARSECADSGLASRSCGSVPDSRSRPNRREAARWRNADGGSRERQAAENARAMSSARSQR